MINGPGNLGRFTKGDTITWKVTSTSADVPTTLAGTPALKVYEEGSATEFLGGVDFTADYDGKTGLIEVIIDTSDSAYSAGKHYDVFVSAGTLGLGSAVGSVVGHFALIPEPADLQAINGDATDGNNATLKLAALDIQSASGQIALNIVAGATDPGDGAAGVHIEGGLGTLGGGNGIEILGGSGWHEDTARGGRAIRMWGGDSRGSNPGQTALSIQSGDGVDAESSPALLVTGIKGGQAVAIHGGDSSPVDGGGGAAVYLWGGEGHGDSSDEPDGYALQMGTDAGPSTVYICKETGDGPVVHIDGEADNMDAVKLEPSGTGLPVNPPELDLADGVETGMTLREALRIVTAALAGKLTGPAPNVAGTVAIRDVNDTKTRISATVDANSQRTAVTLDPS